LKTLKCIAKPKLQNPSSSSSSRFNALEGKSYCGFPLGFQRQKRKFRIAMMFHFFPMIFLYHLTFFLKKKNLAKFPEVVVFYHPKKIKNKK
jgi:hypothetical protein